MFHARPRLVSGPVCNRVHLHKVAAFGVTERVVQRVEFPVYRPQTFTLLDAPNAPVTVLVADSVADFCNCDRSPEFQQRGTVPLFVLARSIGAREQITVEVIVLLIAPDHVSNGFCLNLRAFGRDLVWIFPGRNRRSPSIKLLFSEFEVLPAERAPRAFSVYEGPLEVFSVPRILVDARLDLLKSSTSGVFGFKRWAGSLFICPRLFAIGCLGPFNTTHVSPDYSAR